MALLRPIPHPRPALPCSRMSGPLHERCSLPMRSALRTRGPKNAQGCTAAAINKATDRRSVMITVIPTIALALALALPSTRAPALA
eukprot:4060480-Alexandrium_andersonii.AAC.1